MTAPLHADASIPAILAEREGVLFVAVMPGGPPLQTPERHRRPETGMVPVPCSPEEASAAEIPAPAEPGGWRRVAPRADLLAPALARLLAGQQQEMTLYPSRDGLKATLVSRAGERRPYPIAARDALPILAAVLQAAPRGVVRAGAEKASLLLDVRPGPRPAEFRLRLAGVTGAAPAGLAQAGVSPALLEALDAASSRPGGLWLVAGDSGSGRSTTLSLLAGDLTGRGLRGGRIGGSADAGPGGLPWLAPSLADWPFPGALHEAAPDFVLLEGIDLEREAGIAARLSSLGTRVLATIGPFEPEALAARVATLLDASAPPAPVLVLQQALLRSVCPACVEWHLLVPGDVARLGLHPRDVAESERHDGLAVPRGRGCRACGDTGCAGLVGVFAGHDTRDGARRRPSLREEGWRKVLEGAALHLDVAGLAGRQPMATLREIVALAGSAPLPAVRRESAAPEPAAQASGRAPAVAASGAPPPGSAELDAQALLRLVRDADTKGASVSDGLAALATTLAGRAAHGRLAGLLASGDGAPNPSLHAVNTALIAVRLVTALGQGEDAPATALLALVHDPELFGDDGRGDGTRRLRALGFTDPDAARRFGEVRALLGPDPGAGSDRPQADLRSQAVALAARIHRAYAAGRAGGLDLHDVTSGMMVEHGRSFSPMLFRALLRAIPIFPIGCLVELSSGDLARVVSQNDENHFRPRVEITAARGVPAAGEARVVDLARAPFLHIRHRVASGRGAEGVRA